MNSLSVCVKAHFAFFVSSLFLFFVHWFLTVGRCYFGLVVGFVFTFCLKKQKNKNKTEESSSFKQFEEKIFPSAHDLFCEVVRCASLSFIELFLCQGITLKVSWLLIFLCQPNADPSKRFLLCRSESDVVFCLCPFILKNKSHRHSSFGQS